MDIVYLDNAATTQVCPEAAQAALQAMTEDFGNPSSTHALGRRAAAMLAGARKQVAAALSCRPEEIFFTSGGTESDNWALRAGAMKGRGVGRHIISSPTEHDAVRQTLSELKRQGWEVTCLEPEADGSISPEAVRAALRPDTCLVSLMLVNNETGGITDIAAVAGILREAGSRAILHTDAVQGFLKVPCTPKALGAQLISLSGHKIHAPKGVGALYIQKGLHLGPLLFGGGQEGGLRSGTEALPQIAAFGAAAQTGAAAMAEATARMAGLKAAATARLAAENPGLVLIPGDAPHILCLSLPGYRSEVLLNFLDAKGICVSRSSACKRGRRSHVLTAMGLSGAVIDGSIRISLSRYSTQADIDAFCDALRAARETLLPALR